MILDGAPYSIACVLPADHRTVIGFGFSPDVYVPLATERERSGDLDTKLLTTIREHAEALDALRREHAGLLEAMMRDTRASAQPWKIRDRLLEE